MGLTRLLALFSFCLVGMVVHGCSSPTPAASEDVRIDLSRGDTPATAKDVGVDLSSTDAPTSPADVPVDLTGTDALIDIGIDLAGMDSAFPDTAAGDERSDLSQGLDSDSAALICSPGEEQCNDGVVRKCSDSGEEWLVAQECTGNQVCWENACCQPDCGPDSCGDDGCGGTCGECSEGLQCREGLCAEICEYEVFSFSCTSTPPFELGCPCQNNNECVDGDCFWGICSKVCNSELGCPYGTTCVNWADCDPNPCPDQCLHAFTNLMWPCRGGCFPNGACLNMGPEGWFCGAPCGYGKGCPEGTTCGPVVMDWTGYTKEQCIPDGVSPPCSCPPDAVEAQASTVCWEENSLGTCFGTRTCTPQGLSSCSASTPDGMNCQTLNGCGSTCQDLIEIPAGSFFMGTDDPDMHDNQHPRHLVTLSSYKIRKGPVTAADYQACVAAGACTPAGLPVDGPPISEACTYGVAGKENHPINCVSRNQAAAFCAWKGQSLPTEAQWERAARGTDERIYPWGEAPPSCNLLNFASMGRARQGCATEWTTPAGSYLEGASPTGALDMSGNVSEWVSDRYAEDAYEDCAAQECLDPTGPATGTKWVIRGGSWNDTVHKQTTTSRWHSNGIPSSTIGFRCVED